MAMYRTTVCLLVMIGGIGLVACGSPGESRFETSGSGPFEGSRLALIAGNGLSSNGLPSNGLPSNGLPSNGLPSNGLPSNGLQAGGALTSAAFANWFHWFQGCAAADGCDPNNAAAGSTGPGTSTSLAMADHIMKYIVECACPSTTTLSYQDRTGATHSWTGLLNLAPTWCGATPAAAPVAEQEWVSACLLAVTNRAGATQGSMQLSMFTANKERSKTLAPSSAEDTLFNVFPNNGSNATWTAYWGNIFGSPSSGAKGAFAGYLSFVDFNLGRMVTPETGRDCAFGNCPDAMTGGSQTGGGPNSSGGVCALASTTVANAGKLPATCPGANGQTFGRVIVVRTPPNFDIVVSGGTNLPGYDAAGYGAIQASLYAVAPGMDGVANIAGRESSKTTFTLPSSVYIKVRYMSTAPGAVRIGTSATSSQNSVYTLPATNGYYNSFVIGPVAAPAPNVYFNYVDSTSPNVQLDGVWIVL